MSNIMKNGVSLPSFLSWEGAIEFKQNSLYNLDDHLNYLCVLAKKAEISSLHFHPVLLDTAKKLTRIIIELIITDLNWICRNCHQKFPDTYLGTGRCLLCPITNFFLLLIDIHDPHSEYNKLFSVDTTLELVVSHCIPNISARNPAPFGMVITNRIFDIAIKELIASEEKIRNRNMRLIHRIKKDYL